MTKSTPNSLGLPEYLFKEKSSLLSKQTPPNAIFSPARAIAGEEGFTSQTAPNQQPQKKQIFLDYNSCYRLWNPNEMALEIAKLKNEEFEEYFYLAVPLHKGQLSVREIKNGEVFTTSVKKNEKILIDHIDSPYAKVESLKKLIYQRGI